MADIYNINGYTDEELYAVLDLSNPTDRELEAKILHMIWKYENFGNSSGDRLVRFFNDIYAHFFNIEGMENAESTPVIEESAPAPAPVPVPPMPPAPAQTQEVVPAGTSYSSGKLNPVFRQTINRIVNIDSQYRNKSAITTDYTFNLSTPLRDVVSMKLNSVQIPYTWYTINANYGSNFLYLKGISPGVTGGSYDIKVQINPGNYTANELVTAVNSSFVALRTDPEYTDISFGITGITYDYPSSKSTINIDLRKVYNETDYTFDFGTWSTPNVGANTQYRGNTIPAFLGYNFPSYTPNIIRSRYDILPLIALSTADNAISQFKLTNTNNYFHIYNYTGAEYTTDPSNCTILDDIKITLSLTTGLTYSRSQIVSDLSNQLSNNTKLTNSYISRYDYTASNNTGFIGYNKSYYEMYVELNRFNTKRIQGAKIAIVFSDDNISDIWYGATSALVFEKSSYELSNITSESKAPQSSIVINSPSNNPSHIYLKCKIPRFNGRTDTGNVISGGNTIANDFKININNSPAGGYTFNNYLKQINDQIFDASNNGNINTTNTLLSVEDSFTKVKLDINKRFRENAYKLDTTAASFVRTLGFTGDPDLSFNSISGTPYTSATYNIPQGATIMIIKPKTTGANKDINPYVVINNTGQAILTTSISEVSTQIASICASHLDEYGDNVLSGTTLTFATQQNGLTVATLRVIVNKYLIEQFYDIQFVDPSANTISSRIVGCGIGTDVSSNTYGVLAYSDNNGSTWSGTTSTIFSTKANASAYNGNIWIAAGQGAGNTLATSTNGSIWTGLGKSVFSTEATGVAWNGSIWIATGQGGNTLARSTNGTTWTGLGSTTFTVKATGIAWNGNVFAATGEGGNTIAISQNGTDWTSRATSTLFSTRGTGIAWNEYIWVATGHGGNTIAYSKNVMGNNWTPAATTSLFSTGANGVVWNDSVLMWVAVGTGAGNTIATSYDGNTWTGQGKTTFTTAGYGVSLTGENPPRYIAAGEGGNTIVRSTNGTVWSTTSGTVTFTTGRGIGWDNKTLGKNPTMIMDVSNSWIRNLKLEKSKFDLSEYRTAFSWAQISGVGLVSTDVITISSTTAMNTIKLTPVTTGLNTGTNDYSNGIIITIPDGIYTRDQLITAINNLFANTLTGVNSQNIASGSIAKVITSATGDEFIQIRLNINKVYTSSDYKIVFYDPFSFATVLTTGIINGGRNIGNTSWDSTLGWILGFHEETEYDLSTSKFVLTNGNIKSIIGDNVVSINIYSYFMILLDDFNNSHMNDGIVTTTKKETDVKLPGYTNRTNFNADPISGNLIATNISADGTPLTQKQVYAIQATLDQQTIQTSALKFTEGPFATNVFGLLPLNIANLPNNSIYVDSSIGLRDQQRSYFGPVNIQRMSVKLINDRGETVDLNGANWSFSFICEQLYQNNRA